LFNDLEIVWRKAGCFYQDSSDLGLGHVHIKTVSSKDFFDEGSQYEQHWDFAVDVSVILISKNSPLAGYFVMRILSVVLDLHTCNRH
jgi:hypothetical protein